MAIEVVVFDLGKVIFDFDIDKLSNGFHLSSQRSQQDVIGLISGRKDLFISYEKGLITSQEFYNHMTILLGLQIDYKSFCNIWNDIFTPFCDMFNFINILSKKYNLAILSNTNILHFEYLQNKYTEIFACFKYLHLSYKMQARKPDVEIYKKVIDFYNIDPAGIFFTDDLDKNINSAKELNISAFKFEGLEKLKEDLNSLGVIF
ncbi:MAG: HAD hydrolase-like protein [Endomicrobiaceae bacterium]|nr:HAD hydrolase-like protein [Endomicrobiaceae bacterium]